MTQGIYRIRCLITDDLYIGSSINIERRWEEHRYELNGGQWHGNTNSHLQNAWNKHGETCFEFECIDELPDDTSNERLIEVEQWWIDVLRPAYNSNPTAGRPPSQGYPSWKGRKQSEEHIRKRAEANRGKGGSRFKGLRCPPDCTCSRHSLRGKTYEEIYGDRVEEERSKRPKVWGRNRKRGGET